MHICVIDMFCVESTVHQWGAREHLKLSSEVIPDYCVQWKEENVSQRKKKRNVIWKEGILKLTVKPAYVTYITIMSLARSSPAKGLKIVASGVTKKKPGIVCMHEI